MTGLGVCRGGIGEGLSNTLPFGGAVVRVGIEGTLTTSGSSFSGLARSAFMLMRLRPPGTRFDWLSTKSKCIVSPKYEPDANPCRMSVANTSSLKTSPLLPCYQSWHSPSRSSSKTDSRVRR